MNNFTDSVEIIRTHHPDNVHQKIHGKRHDNRVTQRFTDIFEYMATNQKQYQQQYKTCASGFGQYRNRKRKNNDQVICIRIDCRLDLVEPLLVVEAAEYCSTANLMTPWNLMPMRALW